MYKLQTDNYIVSRECQQVNQDLSWQVLQHSDVREATTKPARVHLGQLSQNLEISHSTGQPVQATQAGAQLQGA